MNTQKSAQKSTLAFAALAAVSAISPAQADIFRIADMIRPIVMSPAQCAAIQNTVWVSAYSQNVCFRYYVSTAGGSGPIPIVYLSGDKLGKFSSSTNSFPAAFKDKDTASTDLQKRAEIFSRRARTTAIYLARVGIDGSSGFHGIRHSLLELHLTNAALHAIKIRHSFTGFNLTGQSGGAGLVGGLLGFRSDIRCAVIGSGMLVQPYAKGPAARPQDSVNPIEYLPRIVQNRGARIIVLTDPQDKVVPASTQTPFVTAIARAGGYVEQYFLPAFDEDHHGMTGYAGVAMDGCIQGAAAPQMDTKLHDYFNFMTALAKEEQQKPNQRR